MDWETASGSFQTIIGKKKIVSGLIYSVRSDFTGLALADFNIS
jgi:hypothetical protein